MGNEKPVSDTSVTRTRSRILKGGAALPKSFGRSSTSGCAGYFKHRFRVQIMDAATQQRQGTITSIGSQLWPLRPPPARAVLPLPLPMISIKPRQYSIRGITLEGRTFRPSDWSERLAGAMSSFRPGGGVGGIGAFIGYSPYCVPQVIDGVKCVLVNEALRGIEPMAWDFVMNFARDNHLTVVEVVQE
jgi:hypothetical protein